MPQIINALLSKHNFILLGLRGQAKSRILRSLTTLLDPALPYDRDGALAGRGRVHQSLLAELLGDQGSGT